MLCSLSDMERDPLTFPFSSSSAVGKSWLLLRWVGETAKLVKGASPMSTIGIDFKLKSILIDGKRWKVQVVSLR